MSTETLRVLLVEDSQAQADLIEDMLSLITQPTYRVGHVVRLQDALPYLRGSDVDVVLLDLNLPDSKGPEGIDRVRLEAPGLPIIVLTNIQDDTIAAQSVRSGAQDYLIKREVEPKLLARSIRYAIERKHAEEALRESEQRYALAVAGANDGLWDWDLVKKTIYYSPRWKAILGYPNQKIGNSIDEWFGRVYPEDRASLDSALEAHLSGNAEHFEHEHRIRKADGTNLWVLCRGLAVREPGQDAVRIAGSLTDISQRKRAEEQLLHDALHDSLTSLPNRTLFMDRLDLAIKRYRRHEERLFAVLFFDLDRFKNVNDSLGHIVGDELLVLVARRVERFLRPGDTFARLGGDEFAILLNDVGETRDATHVAERVHELLSEVFIIREHEVFASASVGIAISSPKHKRPEEILRDADLAMYRAKTTGNTSYEVFDTAMHENAVALHHLETDLRRAVEREEFLLHYQPIVSLGSGRILGFEALLRWQHPHLGLMHPDYFIQVAEETGLTVPVGWWVLAQACAQMRDWQALFPVEPPLSISVNISGKFFVQPDMPDRLRTVLAESELTAASLRLEITESAIMNHGEEALTALGLVREMGVQLHVDDFGTGYSSLSYLQRFAYDSLKIDRSFVGKMDDQEGGNAIVKAIVALGTSLGMTVIAEGVETRDQLQQLRDMHCPEGQGFWFSKPLDQLQTHSLLTGEFGQSALNL